MIITPTTDALGRSLVLSKQGSAMAGSKKDDVFTTTAETICPRMQFSEKRTSGRMGQEMLLKANEGATKDGKLDASRFFVCELHIWLLVVLIVNDTDLQPNHGRDNLLTD